MLKHSLMFLSFLALGSIAYADEKEADSCLRNKIWSGYDDGWAVRTATTTSLAQDDHRVYLVTLYAGNEYKFEVCGDKAAQTIDLVLHDAEGREIKRAPNSGQEPLLEYKPAATQTYYVALYASEVKGGADAAGVALAVTYR